MAQGGGEIEKVILISLCSHKHKTIKVDLAERSLCNFIYSEKKSYIGSIQETTWIYTLMLWMRLKGLKMDFI